MMFFNLNSHKEIYDKFIVYDIIQIGGNMNKNVLILYTNYGTGHYIAAKGIEEYIINKYPKYNIEVFDPLSYSRPLINKLFAKTGQIVATRFRTFRGKLYEKQMYRNYLKKPWYFNIFIKLFWTKKLERRITSFNPDIIISTQVGPTGLVAANKKMFDAKLVAVYTDYGVHRMYTITHEDIDVYCVSDDNVKKQMINLGINSDKIEVTGIPVRSQILDKIDKKERKIIINRYNLENDKPIFLFMCGGGLGYDNAFKYFKELLESEYEFSYIFISGKNKKLLKKAEKLAAQYEKKGTILGYVKNIGQLIACSDIVLGKPGGSITSECLNIGTPICAIEPIPGQEIHNANFIRNNNFGFYITNKKEFRQLLDDLKNKKVKLETYNKSIKKNFQRFSFINIKNII